MRRGPDPEEISCPGSRDVNLFGSHDVDGILDTCTNILHAKVRVVVLNDPFKWNSVPHQFEHALYGNSGSCNTGLPEMDIGVNCDSLPS